MLGLGAPSPVGSMFVKSRLVASGKPCRIPRRGAIKGDLIIDGAGDRVAILMESGRRRQGTALLVRANIALRRSTGRSTGAYPSRRGLVKGLEYAIGTG